MTDVHGTYDGNWKVDCINTHNKMELVIDAQDGFSPTLLCATSLGACAVMTMGYYARKHNLDVTGISYDLQEHYSKEENKIIKIELIFHMPKNDFTDEQKKKIERVAKICPVAKSLHPDIDIAMSFEWPS
ncbi:MAG: OsmC family protein [Desulfovibrionaceae bacterium]|nr:OsmC family protein [Desulfovibrionaceae bacterium]